GSRARILPNRNLHQSSYEISIHARKESHPVTKVVLARRTAILLTVLMARSAAAQEQQVETKDQEVAPNTAPNTAQDPAPNADTARADAERIGALEARIKDLESRPTTAQTEPQPLATPSSDDTIGWSKSGFYLRSRDGAFTLLPSMRLQIDGYGYSPSFSG